MTLNIRHHGIELTPAIHQYLEEKFSGLTKYLDSINHIDVEVGKVNEHMFECKANVQIAGEVFQVDRTDEDLYKSIDKVKDHLRVEIVDWKKKMEDRSMGKM
jgi:putative sigma-54 modulation protein